MDPQRILNNPINGLANFDELETMEVFLKIGEIKKSQTLDRINLHRAKSALAKRYAKLLEPYAQTHKTTRARLTFIRAFTKTLPYYYLARNEDFIRKIDTEIIRIRWKDNYFVKQDPSSSTQPPNEA